MTRVWIVIGVIAVGLAAWIWTSSLNPTAQNGTQGTMIGETSALFDGGIATWAKVGEHGKVTAVGATVALETVKNAPTGDTHEAEEGGHEHAEAHSVRLGLPEPAQEATYFDHLQIDYNPAGHAPAPYEVPHFDFHFYGISTETQLAIDCTNRTMPPDALVPARYRVLPPKPEPEGGCVPEMGDHAIPTDAPELREENPAPFTQTMILGYYAGELTFLEPMLTRQHLLAREGFAMSVPVPERLDRSTRYPTRFKAVYDASENAYRLIWSDFVAMK